MSRASVVAMLVAVEILIAGIGVFVVRNSVHGHMAFASGMHGESYVRARLGPVDAGSAPVVAVNDPQSRVEVAVSSDGRVHVIDETSLHGLFGGEAYAVPDVHLKKTADGVSVDRDDYEHPGIHVGDRKIRVEVPAGSRVEIAHCSGANVDGIDGGVTARSQDGSIEVANVRGGAIDVQSEDGHVTVRDVAVSSLTARTHDGRVTASNVAVSGDRPQATLHSDDGSVHVQGSFAPGGSYDFSSDDGSMELALSSNANLTVAASTSDGRIVIDGVRVDNPEIEAAQHTLRLGDGSGTLRLATNDGSIHITTHGVPE